jgi:hypothetical protein
MRRGYSPQTYLDLVQLIRSIIPEVSLTSDFIAGFCGETEVWAEGLFQPYLGQCAFTDSRRRPNYILYTTLLNYTKNRCPELEPKTDVPS